jgi:hypothetical protein
VCVDPLIDPKNCGACGKVCSGGGCMDGQCCTVAGLECGGDAECCSGHCVLARGLLICSA